jgi:hypothetical protein
MIRSVMPVNSSAWTSCSGSSGSSIGWRREPEVLAEELGRLAVEVRHVVAHRPTTRRPSTT